MSILRLGPSMEGIGCWFLWFSLRLCRSWRTSTVYGIQAISPFFLSVNSPNSYFILFKKFMTSHTAYLVVIVAACYLWPLEGMPTSGDVHLVHLSPSFVSTFPVQVFAFTCAQNVGLQAAFWMLYSVFFFAVISHLQWVEGQYPKEDEYDHFWINRERCIDIWSYCSLRVSHVWFQGKLATWW